MDMVQTLGRDSFFLHVVVSLFHYHWLESVFSSCRTAFASLSEISLVFRSMNIVQLSVRYCLALFLSVDITLGP